MRSFLTFFTAAVVLTTSALAETISVDANANKHAIDPRVYGIAYGDATTLSDLNVALNRLGGNNTSRYNWQQNADNKGFDWYFESIGDSSATAGERGDSFFTMSKNAGAQAMITIPMVGYVAKLGTNRSKLCSFSQSKYGAQQDADWQWFSDAGNGVLTNGSYVTNNNPLDANVAADHTFQQAWVQHFVNTFGTANSGGLRYYILDNEHSIWHSTHRDVHPTGATMDEIKTKMVNYATMIKSLDPNAIIVGPEEWGWSGYIYSGYDQQWGGTHGWSSLPDRANHGNMDYMPWLLDQLRQSSTTAGKRLLDVFTLHYYPQGGEFSNDTSSAMQSRRNRSTRSLWDPNYVDETWIATQVKLIPRMKGWVSTYYPNTPIGITEYNWGAEGHINGATTQADVLGIFGREGLDLAARWTTPDATTPTYKAMKMYRNYDGQKNTFGETSCSASVTNPDNLSAFAAIRAKDGAMTVMVINKVTSSNSVTINLANFSAASPAQAWQLTSSNAITRLADVSFTGTSVTTTVPAQSVTLFIIPAASTSNQAPIVATAASASPSPVTGTTTNLSVLGADDAGEPALTYTWATTGTPPAAVTFSANGTNAAKNSTATFTKAGTYSFQVTIKDAGNLTATGSVNVTVNQTLTTISVSPSSASVANGSTQQFSASAKDQFGAALTTQPTFTWTVGGGGTISSTGLFSATTVGGPFAITATSSAKNGTASVTVTAVNQAPTVVTAASATPNPVTGTTTNLSVLGTDDAGEAALTYTWATTGTPPAAVTFSANGTNAAKNSTAAFTKAGSYSFQVTIKDAGNLTATSSVNVSVNQTLTTITVSPASASVANGGTQQFSATAKDQFGAVLATQPTFTWTVSGGGTINSSGLFTATTAGGPFNVTAASGGKNGTASITVTAVNQAPTVATAASASPTSVSGTTTNLSVLGADDGGEPALTYTWATTGTPPAAVTFSANGTNAAKNSTATFTKAGSYSFQVTIKDAGNLSATSNVSVTVNQTITTISVSPASASILTGATQQFTASAADQFGVSVSPAFSWTVNGGGTISSTGLFTAGSTAGGPFTVTASAGGKNGTGSVTVTAVQVFSVTINSVSTGKAYSVATAQVGALQYIDRSYTITSLNAGLNGGVLIRQANDDKNVTSAVVTTLTISDAATVYVCYDRRVKTVPAWLSGWTLTTLTLSSTDSAASPMKVYSKTFAAGQITLGGNKQSPASGAQTNYIPIVVSSTSAGTRVAARDVGGLPHNVWQHDGDTDGDGLLDAFELAVGLNPNSVETIPGMLDEEALATNGMTYFEMQALWLADPNSIGGGNNNNGGTTGGGGSPLVELPLSISKLSLLANFAAAGKDSASLTANIALNAVPLAGAEVDLNIGGALINFTLGNRGSAKSADGTIRLSKSRKGGINVKAMIRGLLASNWSDESLTGDSSQSKAPRQILVRVVAGGSAFASTVNGAYSCNAGKTGKFAMVKP